VNTSIKRGFAITWLIIATLFGGVAAFQLAALLDGSYDPVVADGMPPERVPPLRVRLLAIIIVSATSGLVAFRYVRRHRGAA